MRGLGGSNNVVKFRKAAPPLDGVAETEAARSSLDTDRAVSTSDLPHQPHTDGFAPEGFEPIEHFEESFVCSDALDSAHGIYGWVAVCLAVECALGLFGWWIA